MRQIWITKAGPPEVLEVKEAPDPEPKSGEVRIRVEATGVNFADIMGRLGYLSGPAADAGRAGLRGQRPHRRGRCRR